MIKGDGQPQSQVAIFTRYAVFSQDLQQAVFARLLQSAESVLGTERHGTIQLTIIRRKVA